MPKTRIAINGFGRIGRAFFKLAFEEPTFEIVTVNDLGDVENLAYLLKYDSVYGRWPHTVKAIPGTKAFIGVDSKEIRFVSEKDPTKLPWKELDVDIVVESTGIFTSYEKSRVHLEAGAKRVVITAPVKDEPPQGIAGATVLMGINHDQLATCQISSNASCTTNAASPVIDILNKTIGVKKAVLSTTHAYTASQVIVDGPKGKDWREGRAAALNMVPTSTGAAIAVTKAIPSLDKKFDGISIRVPVPAGSIADITFLSNRPTSVEEVNKILSDAAQEVRWDGIYSVTNEPLVSSDIVGSRHASIADLTMTRVVDGDLVKVLAWYDNEMGYTHSLVKHVFESARYLEK